MYFRIRSDHNIDDSVNLVQTWLNVHKDSYHSVDFQHEDLPQAFSDGPGVFEWSPSHFNHVIDLKEDAFKSAKKMWADFILVIIYLIYTY